MSGENNIHNGEPLEINDTNFLKVVEEKLSYIKKSYLDEENKIDELNKNTNPFHSKPFQLNNSFEFIEAVKYEKIKEMETFLKANANLLYSFDYYRQTGFHWAAKKNYLKAAKLMIKYGNCVNLMDINHMTPLAICAKNNNLEMCQLLCENGANPFIPNNEGKIPVDLADDIKLKTYLLNWGDNYSKQQNNRLF